jgi:hypothetical protein
VRRIAADLSQRGASVWLDEAAVVLSDPLKGKIRRAIADADYVAVALSHKSLRSTWVRDEIEMAIADEERGDREEKLVLIKLDKCNIPEHLEGRETIDFADPDSYQTSIDLLMGRLKPIGESSAGATTGSEYWPRPNEAFAPVRVLKLWIVFFDGIEYDFVPGRIVVRDDRRVDRLVPAGIPTISGRYYDQSAMFDARLAHYESCLWLRKDRTLADEGIASGDHIIVTVGAGTSAGVKTLVDHLAAAIKHSGQR